MQRLLEKEQNEIYRMTEEVFFFFNLVNDLLFQLRSDVLIILTKLCVEELGRNWKSSLWKY